MGLRSELTVVRVFHLQDACVHMVSLGYYLGRLTSRPFIDAGLRKLTPIDLGNKFVYTPEIMAHRFPSSGREKWPREDEGRVCFSSPKVVELTDNSWHLFFINTSPHSPSSRLAIVEPAPFFYSAPQDVVPLARVSENNRGASTPRLLSCRPEPQDVVPLARVPGLNFSYSRGLWF